MPPPRSTSPAPGANCDHVNARSNPVAPENVGEIPTLVPGNGQKILVVDDETEMCQAMEELLRSLGYRTASAGDAQTALEAYRAWRPDVMLLDRNIPGMDGNSLADRIVSRYPAARILLMSGYEAHGPDGIDDRTRNIIRGYLTKPIDFAELSRMLQGLLH